MQLQSKIRQKSMDRIYQSFKISQKKNRSDGH